MKIFGVGRANTIRTSGNYRETFVFRELFHGTVMPQPLNRFGYPPYRSIRLVRNTAVSPVITFPSISMVIESSIAKSVGLLESADSISAQVASIFSYPMDETSVLTLADRLSAFDDSIDVWRSSIARSLETREYEMRDLVEIIAPHIAQVGVNYDYKKPFPPQPLTVGAGEIKALVTTKRLHENYSLVKCDGVYWMNADLFEKLRSYVSDTQLYSVYTVVL